MLGPNTWPDLPGFADAVTAYYHAVLDVGHRLPDGSLEIGQFGQQALQKRAQSSVVSAACLS